MNILISNDDGIYANGIKALCEALSSSYDVYLIAPNQERSAAGHSITLNSPLRVEEVGSLYGTKHSWAVSGTPGDCVKIGVNAILSSEEQPDIIISGINHGPNLGHDIIYSGTVSCAIEGAMMNIPSIAVSLNSYKPEFEDLSDLVDEKLKLYERAVKNSKEQDIVSFRKEEIKSPLKKEDEFISSEKLIKESINKQQLSMPQPQAAPVQTPKITSDMDSKGDKKSRIIAMHKEGRQDIEIARELGISVTEVQLALRLLPKV